MFVLKISIEYEEGEKMKLYQCDWCEKQRGCKPMVVDGRIYDICAECRAEISSKLKGKGEQAENPLKAFAQQVERILPHRDPGPRDGQFSKHVTLTGVREIQSGQNLM